jgi:hypothetical protein
MMMREEAFVAEGKKFVYILCGNHGTSRIDIDAVFGFVMITLWMYVKSYVLLIACSAARFYKSTGWDVHAILFIHVLACLNPFTLSRGKSTKATIITSPFFPLNPSLSLPILPYL